MSSPPPDRGPSPPDSLTGGRPTRILRTTTLTPARGRAPARAVPVARRPRVGDFLRVPLLLGLLAVVLGLIVALAYVDRFVNLGVTWGAEQTPIAGTGVNPLGVNVFLEKEVDQEAVRRTLRVARDAGFHWIRQGFVWSDIEIDGKGDYVDRRPPGPAHSAWDKYDFIVDQARAFNLEIGARLDATPAWARRAPD
ncbi:MAG TPA: hypothetical protein VFM49_16255, partial [Chloroflexia bacterium]|nr:hypothetical protein [Chloroflexia bacterium]